MIRAAVLALAAFFLVGFGPQDDPYDVAPITRAMHYDGVRVRVDWRFCGVPNGFYDHANRRVVMCYELKPLGAGVIRFVLAHELAHAVIMQREVPYTTSHEAAADELAALTLLWMGRPEDVMAGAEWWANMNRPENPMDDHLGDMRRAFNLACLVMGKDLPLETRCGAKYARATKSWVRLLEMQ